MEILLDACATGRRLTRGELQSRRAQGARAAEAGLALRGLIREHLAAARDVHARLPSGSAGPLLAAVEQVVDAFAEGYERAQHQAVRQEEAARREFVDDLLYGRSDLGRLVDRFGNRHILLTTKDGRLICVVPGDQPDVLAYFAKQAYAATDGGRVARSRSHAGAGGVVQAYEEALNAVDLAERMDLEGPVLHSADLLVYPVLSRDRQAMADLVESVLGPLRPARGGAQPLLDTLTAYFDSGCVATEAARRLSLSVRALTYRLERIHTLTAADPADPRHRYTLQTAVIGARLLEWPDTAA